MNAIIILFIISLVIFILSFLVHIFIKKAIRKALGGLFDISLSYTKGENIYSFTNFSGEGDDFNFIAKTISNKISILALFRQKQRYFINTLFDDIEITLKDDSNTEDPELTNFQKFQQSIILPKSKEYISLERWAFQRILFYGLAALVKSQKAQIKNLRINKNGFTLLLKSLGIEYKRGKDQMICTIQIQELLLLQKDVLITRIPSISFKAENTSYSIIYFLHSFIKDFEYSINSLNIEFNEGHALINECIFHSKVPKNDFVDGNFLISGVDILIPTLDLNTKTMSVNLKGILFNAGLFQCESGSIERNGMHLITFDQYKYHRNVYSFDSFDLLMSMPFMIDIGLFSRHFFGINGKKKNILYEMISGVIEKSLIAAPMCTVTFEFSDNHRIVIPMKKAYLQNFMITAKSFEVSFQFPDRIYTFLKAKNGELNIKKPNFALVCREGEFTFNSEFAELSYISEIFNLINFTTRQIEGDIAHLRENMPQTSKRYSFTFLTGSIRYEISELVDAVEISNAAKLDAIEQLRIRQEKAIQILTAKQSTVFNSSSFEEESRKQLFSLFKDSITNCNLPPPQKTMFDVQFSNLDFQWDGPALANREDCLTRLQMIDRNLNKEDVGRVVGGALTLNASQIKFNYRHFGTILSLKNVQTNGWLLNAKARGKNRSDFIHYKVSCDGGQTEFLIPDVSARSVYFVDFDMHAKNIFAKSTPILEELRQDMKLCTAQFRMKKYKFRKIYMFDIFRLRWRWVFKIYADEFLVHHYDMRNPFSPTPFLEYTLPKFQFSFDRRVFQVNSTGMIAKMPTNIGERIVFSLPAPTMTFRIVSHNDDNANCNVRPTFIPIDAYRFADHNYKPYAMYCTHTFSIHSTIDFGDGFVNINGDSLQSIMRHFVLKEHAVNNYTRPEDFIFRYKPYPTYSFCEVNLVLPKINVTFNHNKANLKLTGDPLIVKISTENGMKIACNSSTSTLTATLLEQQLMSVVVNGLDISTKESLCFKARSVQGELDSDFIDRLSELDIELPPPKKKNPMPLFKTEEELMRYFTTQKYSIEVLDINLALRIVESNSTSNIVMQNAVLENWEQDTKTSLNIVRLKQMKVQTKVSTPLAQIENVTLHIASGLTNVARLVSIGKASMNFHQEDFDDIIPAIKKRIIQKSEEAKKDKDHKRNAYFSLSVDKFDTRFFHPDGYIMAHCGGDVLLFHYLTNTDQSALIDLSLKSFTAVDDTSDEPFKSMLVTPSDENTLLTMKLKKARHIMKTPVVERIEIQLEPFNISISIPFIKEFISVFPYFEELKNLDIAKDVNDDQQQIPLSQQNPTLTSSSPKFPLTPSTSVDPISDVTKFDQEMDTAKANQEGSFFCRELIFHPFSAQINFRRKHQGAFKESVGRSMNHPGIHIYDIFGTEDYVIGLLKKNIKSVALKSLSNIFRGKSVKISTPTKTLYQKPKDLDSK